MRFEEMFPLSFYINLDKRTDRKEQALIEFDKMGINPHRFKAVTGEWTNNKWWNGAIGCMLSHMECLKAGLQSRTNVFIFEDDIKFIGENPQQILENALDELNEIEWDMFYIGGNILKPFYQKTNHLAKLNHCQSTVCYGVRYQSIINILSYIHLDQISCPIDVIYSDKVVPENNCYITVPMLGVQRDSYSDIENQNVEYESYLEKRYWYHLKRKEENG